MSWARTAIALIGFGFTIVQFFERLETMSSVAPARHPSMPRYIGLALIACGTVGLAVGALEYRSLLRYLWSTEFRPIAGIHDTPAHTPMFVVSVVIVLIGIVAFTAVLLRVP